jgi:mRNA interferase RelE/StbE
LTEADRWILAAHARRELRRLDPPVQRRVVEALDRLTGEAARGDVVRLAGSDDEWRLRVGDWRVRFTRGPDGQVQVLRILPRGRAYDR